jgi:hypothetical protein
MTAVAVARATGYSADWIGQIARRNHREGPIGVRDPRHVAQERRLLLTAEPCAELRQALAQPHPEGDRWCGRTVAASITEHVGRAIGRQTGWRYLRRLGARWRKPRPAVEWIYAPCWRHRSAGSTSRA